MIKVRGADCMDIHACGERYCVLCKESDEKVYVLCVGIFYRK